MGNNKEVVTGCRAQLTCHKYWPLLLVLGSMGTGGLLLHTRLIKSLKGRG